LIPVYAVFTAMALSVKRENIIQIKGFVWLVLIVLIFSSILSALHFGEFNWSIQAFSFGLYDSVENLVRYYSMSYFLAERLLSTTFEHINISVFAFMGFMSDWLFYKLGLNDAPIVAGGTGFISENLVVGENYGANVLYSWWVWFYSAFGWFGIPLQVIWSVIILEALRKLNLQITFLYFTAGIFFFFWYRHPFLSAENVYALFAFVAFDLLINRKIRIFR